MAHKITAQKQVEQHGLNLPPTTGDRTMQKLMLYNVSFLLKSVTEK